MTRGIVFAAGIAAALGTMPAAVAADYPTRPVTLVLGFSPGGPSDVVARVVSVKATQLLGQRIVIDNRPGAGGNIAGEYVARAAPDGYTLLLGNNGILATNISLYQKTGFDPIRDFQPITLVGVQANVLYVHPSVPARSLAELIEYAKANPRKLNYASGGHGTAGHLAGELFKTEAKIDIVHVPYKGTGPALQDVLAGHVQMGFSAVPARSSSISPRRMPPRRRRRRASKSWPRRSGTPCPAASTARTAASSRKWWARCSRSAP